VQGLHLSSSCRASRNSIAPLVDSNPDGNCGDCGDSCGDGVISGPRFGPRQASRGISPLGRLLPYMSASSCLHSRIRSRGCLLCSVPSVWLLSLGHLAAANLSSSRQPPSFPSLSVLRRTVPPLLLSPLVSRRSALSCRSGVLSPEDGWAVISCPDSLGLAWRCLLCFYFILKNH